MITSFRHKGLEAFYKTGTTRGIQAAHAAKLRRILALLDVAIGTEDLNIPAFRASLKTTALANTLLQNASKCSCTGVYTVLFRLFAPRLCCAHNVFRGALQTTLFKR